METVTHPSTPTTTTTATTQLVGAAPATAGAETLLLTLDEVARQLCCARRSVERHVASRRLRVVHLGRSVRVERRELARFIAQMRDPGPADLGAADHESEDTNE